jgi:hypothetical protein
MVNLIQQPTVIMAAGNKSKEIAEYIGRLNSATESLSIAHMKSPAGWSEPGQTPKFDEYTVVFRAALRAETRAGTIAPTMWRCVCRPFLRNWYGATNEGSHMSRRIAPNAEIIELEPMCEYKSLTLR